MARATSRVFIGRRRLGAGKHEDVIHDIGSGDNDVEGIRRGVGDMVSVLEASMLSRPLTSAGLMIDSSFPITFMIVWISPVMSASSKRIRYVFKATLASWWNISVLWLVVGSKAAVLLHLNRLIKSRV